MQIDLLKYWIELRRRLLRGLVYFLLCFEVLFYYRKGLMEGLLAPLDFLLPGSHQFVLTSLGSAMFFSITLAMDAALFLTIPYLIFEGWRFVLPALYREERRLGLLFLISSQLLFVLGAGFAYTFVLPAIWHYTTQVTPAHVTLMLDIQNTVDFIVKLFLVFGLCFQVPLLCLGLAWCGWLTIAQLKSVRRYVIVLAFIIGMLIAPPDVFSQTLIALPLWGLFEIGLVMGSLLIKEPVKS